jgi:hypothetical protein
MIVAAMAGGLLALAGLAGLGWIALRARAVARADLAADAARAEWRKLMALNGAAVGVAFLGLALLLVAAVVGG